MLERMWSKRKTHPLLVGKQPCTTACMSWFLRKLGVNLPQIPAIPLGNITKRCPIIPQKYLFNYVHSSNICNSQNLEKPRCPSVEEWIKEVWHIYTLEYYSVIKSMTSLILHANGLRNKTLN